MTSDTDRGAHPVAIAKTIAEAVASFGATFSIGDNILDVGCGLRPYEGAFPHGSYLGIDIELSGRQASGKLADKFYDGSSFPFADASFQGALCTQVLEHCQDPDAIVKEIERVLVPGGTALVTVPLIWGEHEAPYDFRRYTTFGVARLFESAGMDILHVGRLTTGIDAIATLVSSEINAYNLQRPDGKSYLRRQKERAAHHLWRLQLATWRRLYSFPRIYLDNLVLARKRVARSSDV